MKKSPEEYTRGLTGTHDKYDQGQKLRGYHTSDTQFPNPEEMVVFSGFGANKADIERGFCEPDISERPEYDKANYYQRWTEPKNPDEGQGNTMALSKDYEFRTKDVESKGFLTRPRTPTER